MSKTYLRKPITIKFINGEEKTYQHDIIIRHKGVIVFATLSKDFNSSYCEELGTSINGTYVETIDQIDDKYIDSYYMIPTKNILEIKSEENQEGNGNVIDYLLEFAF